MSNPKKDLIFNGNDFNVEFFHNGKTECPYCFLNFMHQHPKGSNLKEFIKINLPKKETWEEKYDRKFLISTVLFEEYQKDGVLVLLNDIKDFIRREFI